MWMRVRSGHATAAVYLSVPGSTLIVRQDRVRTIQPTKEQEPMPRTFVALAIAALMAGSTPVSAQNPARLDRAVSALPHRLEPLLRRQQGTRELPDHDP